jgi:hypothetical protein
MEPEHLKIEVNKGFDEIDDGIVSYRSFTEIAREAIEPLVNSRDSLTKETFHCIESDSKIRCPLRPSATSAPLR